VIEEDGFVMRIFSNGFVVFVPRFGIEGLIRLKDLTGSERDEVDGVFDQAEYRLEFDAAGKGKRAVELFQKVKVRIEDELEVSTGKRKIKLNLI
jgi:exosome complex exonuclease DIS3/RRP44